MKHKPHYYLDCTQKLAIVERILSTSDDKISFEDTQVFATTSSYHAILIKTKNNFNKSKRRIYKDKALVDTGPSK